MKIKHWQGYGKVEAKKIFQKKVGNIKTIVIRVTGNHEWGLKRNDTYDIHRWLCSKLAKDCVSERDIINMSLDDYHNVINGENTEVCDYTIKYYIN